MDTHLSSLSVREPLDKIDVTHSTFDAWEIVLYVMALSFMIEGIYQNLIRSVAY